jgi:trehalose 6-phosphate phosphatase
MKLQEREDTYAEFLERVRTAAQRVLLLDYDGTLAPFTVDREHAFPYPEVPPLLAQIATAGTRLVLISGRPARDVLLLSGIHPHPEIWGSHGLERLKPDGTYEAQPLSERQLLGLRNASEALRTRGIDSRTETKPGSVAVHWRGLQDPEVQQIRNQVKELWISMASERELELREFDGGLELRASGINKGNAVRTILEESGADSAVAYLGDDLTDEDAFRALHGRGLSALVRPEFRTTAADVWLRPPQELIRFLSAWLRATGGEA